MSKLSKLFRTEKPVKEKPEKFPIGYSEIDKSIFLEAKPFTMTDREKVLSLIHAVRYVTSAGIPGDIVECGVWRGGSMMAIARTLLNMGVHDRELHLFDTFEGMPTPTAKDVNHKGHDAREFFDGKKFNDREGSDWCYAALDEVKANLARVGYPAARIHYIQGKVEDTLPAAAPERIALLRLDTDWYESTLHEMRTLYPRLVPGGVLIIDDYYTWKGSKDAVDEYMAEHGLRLFLAPLSSGATAIKPA
ncbi:MAG: class I SAM-dependent methyltransferase [Planctomycetes bacterium]|nr:class I SAM-dependent methyltransferase [Planctomycetota bacterium]